MRALALHVRLGRAGLAVGVGIGDENGIGGFVAPEGCGFVVVDEFEDSRAVFGEAQGAGGRELAL